MSTVDNRLHREILQARVATRPPGAVVQPGQLAKKVNDRSHTASADVGSGDTVVVPRASASKSPIGSLGRWRIDVAQPAEPAFNLSPSPAGDSSFSLGRNALQRYAPSLVSLIVHCLVVLFLGIMTFSTPESRGVLLSGVFTEEDISLSGDVTTELTAPETLSAPALSLPASGGNGIEEALASLSSPISTDAGNAGARVNVNDIFGGGLGDGEGHGGGAPSLAELQAGKSAQFYGLSAQGKRFVFVIDSSTSMWGSRWIEVRKELIRSIRRLEKDQYFFVVCFDVTSLSMFGAKSLQKDFSPATEENFRKLEYWLSQHTLGPGTRATASLSEALRLKPDAIFLLTDGEFQDNVVQMLRTNNRNKAKKRKTTVNTIGFHSQMGAPILSQIATENYGQFRYIAPPPNLPLVQPSMRFTGRVYPPQTLEELKPRF